jgi:deoxyadenosine/deoxycytidine kinase/ribonuclease HI
MNTPFILSIDGNIGSGKSTLYADLQKKYENNPEICFVPEPVDEWAHIKDHSGTPILTNLYRNTKKYAFRFQMMAYISRLHLLRQKVRENKYKIIISERCVQSDKNVFAQMLYDDDMIDHDEFQIYLNWFDEFLDDIKVGGIVYVRVEPTICADRVNIRAREGEQISLEYLTKCHNYHEQWLNNTKLSKLVIDANVDTSLPENTNTRSVWVETINTWLHKNMNMDDTNYTDENENIDNNIIADDISIDSLNMMNMPCVLQFNGICIGSPTRLLGLGAVIYDINDDIIYSSKRNLKTDKETKNSVAEYIALIDGLRLAKKNDVSHLIVESDSHLIVSHINNSNAILTNDIKQYHHTVTSIMKTFTSIEFRHISHLFNGDASRLAKEALDET